MRNALEPIATKRRDGSWEISAVIAGVLERRVYYEYTKREAIQNFREDVKPARKKNPALALIVPNPPHSSDWSDRVYAIQYKHKQDGDDYEHEFQRGVCLRANTDGSVTLYRRDGRPVWEEFPG